MRTQHKFAVALLSLTLIACGNTGSNIQDATPAAIALTGDPSVAVGENTRVTSIVKNATGQTVSADVTYTSDQPNVIDVDASGNLIIKRLNAINQPVTIAAAVGKISKSMQIRSYGVEMALGTHVRSYAPDAEPGLTIIARYRPESASTAKMPLTITTPTGYQLTEDLRSDVGRTWLFFALSPDAKYPDGTYTLTYSMSGKTFTTADTITERNAVLGFIKEPTIEVGDSLVKANGTPAPSAEYFYGDFYRADAAVDTYQGAALPAKFAKPVWKSGETYYINIRSLSDNIDNFSTVLARRVRASTTYIGSITVK